jgi:hypothetical protein
VLDFILFKFLKIQERVVSAGGDSDQFVQLCLHCSGITVLGVLNQEYHQEGYDRGPGIDDQLPRVVKVENRARNRPGQNYESGGRKRQRMARRMRSPFGKGTEPSRKHLHDCYLPEQPGAHGETSPRPNDALKTIIIVPSALRQPTVDKPAVHQPSA